MDQNNFARDVLQTECPIDRAVASSHNNNFLAPKLFLTADTVSQSTTCEMFLALYVQFRGRKRADSPANNHRARRVFFRIGPQKPTIRTLLQFFASRPQNDLRVETVGLLQKANRQIFRQNFRKARHIVNQFLRIERRITAMTTRPSSCPKASRLADRSTRASPRKKRRTNRPARRR